LANPTEREVSESLFSFRQQPLRASLELVALHPRQSLISVSISDLANVERPDGDASRSNIAFLCVLIARRPHGSFYFERTLVVRSGDFGEEEEEDDEETVRKLEGWKFIDVGSKCS
jgi:hypothetical protein